MFEMNFIKYAINEQICIVKLNGIFNEKTRLSFASVSGDLKTV